MNEMDKQVEAFLNSFKLTPEEIQMFTEEANLIESRNQMSNDDMNNDRNPDVRHDPSDLTEDDRKTIERKVRLLLSMAGDIERNPDIVLTVLSYALVHAGMQARVTFASVVKVLADMYDSHPNNPETGGDSDE